METRRLKVVILGDGAVGKTCLLATFESLQFPEEYVPTVFENRSVKFETKKHGKITLDLWDTAGQEEYDRLRHLSFPGAHAFIVTYSVASRSSFENTENVWMAEIRNRGYDGVPVILVGLKTDLRDALRENLYNNDYSISNTVNEYMNAPKPPDPNTMVTFAQGTKMSRKIKAKAFIECSAMINAGVQEVFRETTEVALDFLKKKETKTSKSKIKNFVTEKLTQMDTETLLDKMTKSNCSGIITILEKRWSDPTLIPGEYDMSVRQHAVDIMVKLFTLPINLTVKFLKEIFNTVPEAFIETITRNPDFILDIDNADSLKELLDTINCRSKDYFFQLVENVLNERSENLLHRLVIGNQWTLINWLSKHLGHLRFTRLFLARNLAKDSPLMLTVQKSSKQALDFWVDCERGLLEAVEEDNIKLDLHLRNLSRKKNLLHLCAEAKNTELITVLCKTSVISKDDLAEAVNGGNSCPFTAITKEEAAKVIIESLTFERIDSDSKKELFRTACKHDWIDTVKIFADNLETREMYAYIFDDKDKVAGNNGLMNAAVGTSDRVLMFLLGLILFNSSKKDEDHTNKVLHETNKNNHTLLNIVMSQGDKLSIQRDMILRVEREYHRDPDSNDLYDLATCLKCRIGPSLAIGEAIEAERSARTTNSYTTGWIIAVLQFVLPFTIFVADVVTDALLTFKYYNTMMDDANASAVNCSKRSNVSFLPEPCENRTDLAGIIKIASGLSVTPCFYYSLAFLLFPLFFYSYEWYRTQSKNLHDKLVMLMNDCSCGFVDLFMFPISCLFWIAYHFGLILFWPVMTMLSRLKASGHYENSDGEKRAQNHRILERKTIVSSRAQMAEVCIESSFQPLLQLYLTMPCVVTDLLCTDFNVLIRETSISNLYKKDQLQVFAILTSIVSLAWSFNNYESIRKRGALSFKANIVARLLMLGSTLLQIFGRIGCMILFAYCFGEGEFWPLMVFVLVHITIITMILFCSSDNHEPFSQRLFYSFFNGLANLYVHNWIKATDLGSSLISHTIVRELTMEAVIFVENLIVLVMCFCMFDIDPSVASISLPAKLASIAVCFHIFGLFLKFLYYKYYHIWKDLLWQDFKAFRPFSKTRMRRRGQGRSLEGAVSEDGSLALTSRRPANAAISVRYSNYNYLDTNHYYY